MARVSKISTFSNELSHWLNWQCSMISGVKCGGIFLSSPSDEDELQNIAFWPHTTSLSPTLKPIAANTVNSGVAGVHKAANHESQPVDYVTQPLIEQGQVVGSVVLALTVRSEQQYQAVLQLLQWGTVFLEKLLKQANHQPVDDASLALNAVALLSENEPLAVMGYHFCNFLADHFNCSRVQLGLNKGLQVQVLSVSHQLHFDRRIERIRQVEFAMEECIEQNQNIVISAPSHEASTVIKTHTQQLLSDKNEAVCSLILRNGETYMDAPGESR
ncbi:hypothetical protein GCM10009347_11520 [Shewanella algicola]|nr:hypothetical protein GCM10009347_11520 [Shewanella algicola]